MASDIRNIVKFSFLYLLCFYFAFLTPKPASYKSDMENYLFGVVFLSIIQGFVFLGLIEYFDMGFLSNFVFNLTDYRASDWEFGLFVGFWTLVGGLQYPHLVESLHEERKKAKAKASRDNRSIRQMVEDDEREEELGAWENQLRDQGVVKCLNFLETRLVSFADGNAKQTDLRILNDLQWMRKEVDRLRRLRSKG